MKLSITLAPPDQTFDKDGSGQRKVVEGIINSDTSVYIANDDYELGVEKIEIVDE